MHLDWSQLSLRQEHQVPLMPIGELFCGGKCSPVPRGRFVLFLQSQSMLRYTYSFYWIPLIPTQRSYLECSGHTIWQVYLHLQTARSAFVISRSQFLQIIYLNNEMCVFLFLLSLVFSKLRRFFIFDMERLVFTTSLSTLIEVRQINLGKGAKL